MAWDIKTLESQLLIGSTLVEGSTLTEEEAQIVLAGQTIQGHPFSEIRELTNYRAAIEWLTKQFLRSPYLSQDLILDFHKHLFAGFSGEHGRWKKTSNYTYTSAGTRLDYLKPSEIQKAMAHWLESYNAPLESALENTHGIGAKLYYDFQFMHPFEDGNGRIGRILMSYWFHWKKNLSFSFYLKDKTDHLKALEAANQGDLKPLQEFFEKRLKQEK